MNTRFSDRGRIRKCQKKKAGIVSDTGLLTGVPTGIRTPVLTVKG